MHRMKIGLVAAVVLFVFVVALAVCFPAQRALRVEPAKALRHD